MQGSIFVFGGWDTPVCFNDMFMLDLGKYCKNCYSFQDLLFNLDSHRLIGEK